MSSYRVAYKPKEKPPKKVVKHPLHYGRIRPNKFLKGTIIEYDGLYWVVKNTPRTWARSWKWWRHKRTDRGLKWYGGGGGGHG